MKKYVKPVVDVTELTISEKIALLSGPVGSYDDDETTVYDVGTLGIVFASGS